MLNKAIIITMKRTVAVKPNDIVIMKFSSHFSHVGVLSTSAGKQNKMQITTIDSILIYMQDHS